MKERVWSLPCYRNGQWRETRLCWLSPVRVTAGGFSYWNSTRNDVIRVRSVLAQCRKWTVRGGGHDANFNGLPGFQCVQILIISPATIALCAGQLASELSMVGFLYVIPYECVWHVGFTAYNNDIMVIIAKVTFSWRGDLSMGGVCSVRSVLLKRYLKINNEREQTLLTVFYSSNGNQSEITHSPEFNLAWNNIICETPSPVKRQSFQMIQFCAKFNSSESENVSPDLAYPYVQMTLRINCVLRIKGSHILESKFIFNVQSNKLWPHRPPL